MDFKGTKKKWNEIMTIGNKKSKNCFYQIIMCNEKIIAEVKGVHCKIPNEECIYNTLLISKAPQMLNMLEYFIQNNMLSTTGEEMAKKLIKEATQL